MNSLSEFCQHMQAALAKRLQATTHAERIAAIQEMTALIREQDQRRPVADYKVAQSKDGE